MFDQYPDRRAYSDREAHFCAWISALSYREFESKKDEAEAIQKELSADGAELKDQVSRSKGSIDTQAICVEDKGIRFIAFRGTEKEKLTDWFTDTNIKLKDVEDGIEIHQGFWKAYDVVHSKIKGWIEQAVAPSDPETPRKPVVLCGHSLGGALAIVASVRNQSLGPASCYTFGGPRVGFVSPEKIKTPVYRVVNQDDPVADVPPAAFFLSKYRHLGDEFQLQDGGMVPDKVAGDDKIDRIFDVLEIGWSFTQQVFGSSLEEALKQKLETVKEAAKGRAGAHDSALYVERLKKIALGRNTDAASGS